MHTIVKKGQLDTSKMEYTFLQARLVRAIAGELTSKPNRSSDDDLENNQDE